MLQLHVVLATYLAVAMLIIAVAKWCDTPANSARGKFALCIASVLAIVLVVARCDRGIVLAIGPMLIVAVFVLDFMACVVIMDLQLAEEEEAFRYQTISDPTPV